MKILKKLLLSFVVFIVFWLIVLIYISNVVGIKGYEQLENARMNEDLQLLEQVLNNEISKEEKLLYDWAAWDPVYKFVVGEEEGLPEGDLTESVYVDQEMNYVMIFDDELNLILGEGYDLEEEEYKEVPPLFVASISEYNNQSGIMNINGEWIAYSTEQVTNSDETEMLTGLMVFAHTIDENRQNELINYVHKNLEFSVASLSEAKKLPDTEIVRGEEAAEIILNIPFVNENSFLQVKYLHTYDIIALGDSTIRTTVFWFSVSFLIAMSFLFLSIRNGVNRLVNLRKEVENIRITYNLQGRVEAKGIDEIGELGRDINILIEDLQEKTFGLSRLADYDSLTGVLNRRAGLDKLEVLISKVDKNYFPLSICYIDIDGLKKVNDKFGHIEGDRYLNIIVSALKQAIKSADFICRLGGDEFLMVFPHYTELDIEKEMIKINKHLELQNYDTTYKVNFSYGSLMYKEVMSSDVFIDLADAKMYKEKMKKASALSQS